MFTYGQGDLEWYGLPSIGVDEQVAAPAVSVYPNPMAEQCSIQVEEAQLRDGLFFTLTDAMGQMVHKTALTRTTTTLQRGERADGVYFYRIHSAERTVVTGRIVQY